MYALKIELKSGHGGTSNTLGIYREQDADVDEIQVSAGNPRVEHLTGIVHLYRQTRGRDEAEGSAPAVPVGRANRLCVHALPADMGVSDFCSFVGAYLPSIREMRLVRREGGRTSCMVLLTFSNVATTDEFFLNFNNKPFSSLEPEVVCRLLYVKDLEFIDAIAGNPAEGTSAPRPPPGQTELPTCPVCLERLDEHISGVVTTVCNHRFHNECLQRWGDTSCPVCRYCAEASSADSRCSICGKAQDLWMCLICGHVGCGRYREGHAAGHSKESGHAYALELEAQRVWDYSSDNYVHRLVQSKTHGKLVELPSPAPSSSERNTTQREASQMDPQTEEALVASKLDHLATEYSQLLVSQLEQQRTYYDGLLQRSAEDAEAARRQAQQDCSKAEAAVEAAQKEAKGSERARNAAEQKLGALATRLKELDQECKFFKEINAQLELNQGALEKARKAAEESRASNCVEKDAQIKDLEEQVRDLMIYIEAGRSIAAGGEEMKDASLLPVPMQPAPPQTKRRTGKRR